MPVNSVVVDLARDYTSQVIGEAQVQAFDDRGYLETLGGNEHTYFIFAPVRSTLLGDKRSKMTWCVFGVDPKVESGERTLLAREHFFAFRSSGAIVYEELLWLWFALKANPAELLSTGCDPLHSTMSCRRRVTSQFLAMIGKKCGREEYFATYIDSLRRSDPSVDWSAASFKHRKARA